MGLAVDTAKSSSPVDDVAKCDHSDKNHNFVYLQVPVHSGNPRSLQEKQRTSYV